MKRKIKSKVEHENKRYMYFAYSLIHLGILGLCKEYDEREKRSPSKSVQGKVGLDCGSLTYCTSWHTSYCRRGFNLMPIIERNKSCYISSAVPLSQYLGNSLVLGSRSQRSWSRDGLHIAIHTQNPIYPASTFLSWITSQHLQILHFPSLNHCGDCCKRLINKINLPNV